MKTITPGSNDDIAKAPRSGGPKPLRRTPRHRLVFIAMAAVATLVVAAALVAYFAFIKSHSPAPLSLNAPRETSAPLLVLHRRAPWMIFGCSMWRGGERVSLRRS